MAIRHAKSASPGKHGRIKRIIAAVAATGLASIGLVAASSLPAAAHTPSVSTTCEALTVDLQSYQYQAAVPAQGYTEYEWTKTTTDTKTSINSPGDGWVQGAPVAWEYKDKHGNLRWENSDTWNSESNPQSNGWTLVEGQVKYQWTLTTTQTQWSKDSPGKGWTKTGQSRFHETSPAQPEKTNKVVATIDGTQVENTPFATSFNHVYNYDSQYVSHTYSVVVTAWDDPTGSHGWTKTFNGASTACQQPFNWDWQYPAPTCTDGLTVTYPGDIPAGQANDVNIKVKNLSNNEERTFNFHNNSGTWSGTQTFNVTTRPDWPGWTYWEYEWTQVAGTNYHWTGTVTCGDQPPVADATADVTVTPATCTAPATVAATNLVNATVASATGTTGPGDYSVVINSNTGHTYADGTSTKTFTGTLAGPTGNQSTNPSGDCYVPPSPTKVTLLPPTVVDKCGVENDLLAGADIVGVRYESDGWSNPDGSFTINLYGFSEVVDHVTYAIDTTGLPNWDQITIGKYDGWYLNDGGVPTFTVITQNQPCGTQPPDKVVVTEGTPVCGVDTVPVTTTTTPSVWNPITNSWDLGTAKVVNSTRAVTNEEKAGLNCPTTSPSSSPSPSTSTPASTPSPTHSTPAALASTGSNVMPTLELGLLALVMGGALVVIRIIARRRQQKKQA